MSSEYLWDGSGPVDPAVAELESQLEVFRLPPNEIPPGVIPTQPAAPGPWTRIAAIAASITIVALAWMAVRPVPKAWFEVTPLTGEPLVAHTVLREPASHRGRLPLVTGENDRVQLELDGVGTLTIGPSSSIEVLRVGLDSARLRMMRGELHAVVFSEPGKFVIETPHALLEDLGCEFEIELDRRGEGTLAVENGWVGLESQENFAWIPAGSRCDIYQEIGPGVPYYPREPLEVGCIDVSGIVPGTPEELLEQFSLAQEDSIEQRHALEETLDCAESGDALSLWHLLLRTEGPEREKVIDRLEQLVPLPMGTTRAELLSGNRGALLRWWKALQIPGAGNWDPESRLHPSAIR